MIVKNCLIYPKPGKDAAALFDPFIGVLDGYAILPRSDLEALKARLAEALVQASDARRDAQDAEARLAAMQRSRYHNGCICVDCETAGWAADSASVKPE